MPHILNKFKLNNNICNQKFFAVFCHLCAMSNWKVEYDFTVVEFLLQNYGSYFSSIDFKTILFYHNYMCILSGSFRNIYVYVLIYTHFQELCANWTIQWKLWICDSEIRKYLFFITLKKKKHMPFTFECYCILQ